MSDLSVKSVAEIAADMQGRTLTATAVIDATLTRIAALNPKLNAFTEVTGDRARKRAKEMDERIARGEKPGPLAGVPFAVKNLFDISGVTTLAGSKINRELAPAKHDAVLIERLEAAGAILVGALNMGEYAYDFTGRNEHYDHSRNPHDLGRMSGGSSGGSGTAVGASLVPLALGSDTNGSIRVPSSLCGIFGLKPSFGRLSRRRSFPFVASLDHLGPLARTARDLALSYDSMQGPDPEDTACANRPVELALPSIGEGVGGLRIAVAGGYFADNLGADATAAVAKAAKALGVTRTVEFPEAARARAAAFVITASEGAALHLDRIRVRAKDFDFETRDRLLAGALIPAAWVNRAQRFRHWYRHQVAELFKTVDVVLAPSTPVTAPELEQKMMIAAGKEVVVRSNLGLYTQPISFIGLPVAAVPIAGPGMPMGIQVIGRPWEEATVLRVAAELERLGVAAAPVAAL